MWLGVSGEECLDLISVVHFVKDNLAPSTVMPEGDVMAGVETFAAEDRDPEAIDIAPIHLHRQARFRVTQAKGRSGEAHTPTAIPAPYRPRQKCGGHKDQ